MTISIMSGHVERNVATLPHDRPLAWHLTILCFALAVPILILAAVAAWVYADSEHVRLEQNALRTAQQVMAAVDREFAGLIATNKVLALSRTLQRDDLDGFDVQAREVYGQIGLNVVLRDRESRQVVNTRLPRGAELPRIPDRETDPEVLKTKNPVISNLFIGAVSRVPQFSVNVPVLRNGEVVYFLSLSLAPGRVRDIILQLGLPAGWTATIADRRGLVVANSSRDEGLLNQQLRVVPSEYANLNDVVRETDLANDHQSRLAAFSRSQLSGWVAMVSVPNYEATAPLRNALISILGLGGVILALSVALGLLFSQRIQGPVKALAAQAADLGRGREVHPLATSIREVNTLSQVLSDAGRERRDNEARLHLAQTAGRIGTWDWDITSGHAVCSESYYELYGLDPKGPAHPNPEAWLAQVHPDDRERMIKTWQAALDSGRLDSEYRIVRPDGSVRWIVDRGVPVFDADRRLTRFIGVNVDVTERREAERRLQELQLELLHASRLSAMGQMAAALAHELNQPLGAATNFLSAARLALKSARPDASARALERIEKAGEQTIRAGAILGRLRDYVARGETEKRIVSVRQLLEDAVALALVGARNATIQMNFDFAGKERQVLADRVQIQQVVFNLVRNALEATEGRTPREIVLATRVVTNAEIEISVADNGSGLPQNPEAVFQPFATTKSTGMGIGLPICRTIVEAHGGHLWAEARPNGGAVFRFTLPIAPSQEVVDA